MSETRHVHLRQVIDKDGIQYLSCACGREACELPCSKPMDVQLSVLKGLALGLRERPWTKRRVEGFCAQCETYGGQFLEGCERIGSWVDSDVVTPICFQVELSVESSKIDIQDVLHLPIEFLSHPAFDKKTWNNILLMACPTEVQIVSRTEGILVPPKRESNEDKTRWIWVGDEPCVPNGQIYQVTPTINMYEFKENCGKEAETCKVFHLSDNFSSSDKCELIGELIKHKDYEWVIHFSGQVDTDEAKLPSGILLSHFYMEMEKGYSYSAPRSGQLADSKHAPLPLVLLYVECSAGHDSGDLVPFFAQVLHTVLYPRSVATVIGARWHLKPAEAHELACSFYSTWCIGGIMANALRIARIRRFPFGDNWDQYRVWTAPFLISQVVKAKGFDEREIREAQTVLHAKVKKLRGRLQDVCDSHPGLKLDEKIEPIITEQIERKIETISGPGDLDEVRALIQAQHRELSEEERRR